MNIAIVLAGGIGSRVGSSVPKQFIEVLGKPILIYTLETFQQAQTIDEIVLVCLKSHIEKARELCEQYGITKVKKLVAGGSSFLESCINGVNSLDSQCTNEDIVVVTSADRPFTSQEEIEDSIRVTERYGSGIAARKCALCMFEVGEDRSHSHTYLRETLVQTGTPWTFQYGSFADALSRWESGEFPNCEEYPVAVYAAAGKEVYFSKLFPGNIKITEKTDIALMEQMIKEGI